MGGLSIETFKSEEFGDIRGMEINGEPWLVGKDVAIALGYSNPRDAISKHVDSADKGVAKCDTLGGSQQLTIINESGFYSLVFGSKLDSAKRFKHWVTSEVLPSIRKHGAYMTPQTLEKALTDPDFIIRLATNLKDERQKRIEAETQRKVAEGQVLQLTAKVTELKPKADYCDPILASDTAITITQIAADYNMSAKAMNLKLHDIGVQWKVGEQWILYTEYMDKGYTRSETIHFKDSNGREHTKMMTKWTQKGRLFLYDKLKAAGVLPLMEQK